LTFDEDILAFFGLPTGLATFSKIWANFIPIFWSPLWSRTFYKYIHYRGRHKTESKIRT
jgi:hypothetical protein